MSIDVKVLPLHAGVLALDIAKFQQCLGSGKYTAQVRESVADGKQAGVRGTPWFFLGLTGPDESKLKAVTLINGSQPYAAFEDAIDKLLSLPTEQETERAVQQIVGFSPAWNLHPTPLPINLSPFSGQFLFNGASKGLQGLSAAHGESIEKKTRGSRNASLRPLL